MDIPRGPLKSDVTFLAIPLPDDLINQIINVQETLSRQSDHIKLEIPDKLHITLLHFGRINYRRQESIYNRLSEYLNNLNEFTLKVTHLNYFYNKRSDASIWLNIEDADHKLSRLHKDLLRILNNPDQPLSKRKLVPHITIARLIKIHGIKRKQLLDKVLDNSGLNSEFTVKSLQVMTSQYQSDLNTTLYSVLHESLLN